MTGFSSLPSEDNQNDVHLTGVAAIQGPPWAKMPLLTVNMLGVQILWSLEFSYASPYLLSLGLSKSFMAIVLLAGPLSGLFMQPLVGMLADNCRSRFGRRRPYMFLGIVICCIALFLFGYTRSVTSIFIPAGTDTNKTVTIFLAILALYAVDFAINAVMAVDRALIVDTLPSDKQAAGNAWAARMLGLGSVAGFFVGNIDLPKIFGFIGKTELQVLSVLGSLFLILSHAVTASFVKERILVSSSLSKKGILAQFRELWENIRILPHVIRQICIIQLFAWIAWFPVLFYTTTYIGELHKYASPIPSTEEEEFALDEEATRLGSRALFHQSLLALFANFVLPYFVSGSRSSSGGGSGSGEYRPSRRFGYSQSRFGRLWRRRPKMHLGDLWAFSLLVFACCLVSTLITSSVSGASFLVTLTGLPWAIAQWAPFSLLGEEISSNTSMTADDGDGDSILLLDTRSQWSSEPATAIVGRPSSAVVIDEERRALVGSSHSHSNSHGHGHGHVREREDDHSVDDDHDDDRTQQNHEFPNSRSSSFDGFRTSASRLGMGNAAARTSLATIPHEHLSDHEVEGVRGHQAFRSYGHGHDASVVEDAGVLAHGHRHSESSGLAAKAGIILGIHNLSLVFPQFLMNAISAVIFAIFDGPRRPESTSLSTGAHGLNTTTLTPVTGSGFNGTSLHSREVLQSGGANSVAIVFRLGGISAAVACVICWRLAKELKRR